MNASSNPKLEPQAQLDLDPDTSRLDDSPDNSGERDLEPLAPGANARMPELIAGRYRVVRALGRGGMAQVYLVEDGSSGRQLALKQLAVEQSHRHFAELAAQFEREYHTLVQLSHPHIVEVHDFGLDGGPFYTMELLEGGDVRDRAPLPWREACAVIHDVCSTLALLHSRRLVHRDISPRNVRTARDGSTKVIDLGALAPMGSTSQIVGTAPFVAPEVLHRSALDARADLYSLGTTFYFALTGHLAYPARDFGKLPEVWAVRPPPPSGIVSDIPPALDALVMSLIALDPAVRPRSAFDVMQRLAAIAGLPRDESIDVSQAYLSMPVMVGRDDALVRLRARIKQMLTARGGALAVQGPSGIGRSRMLDACALEGKTAGAAVLRVSASAADRKLALIETLAAQLIEVWPDTARAAAEHEQVGATLFDTSEPGSPRLRPLDSSDLDRAALQKVVCRWLLRVAAQQPLLILVDDLHKSDEASLALLAALMCTYSPERLLLVTTHETGAAVRAPDPFDVLQRYAEPLQLSPLSRAETELLFDSVFGDVPNLALLSDRIFRVAAGNPRESMELAHWLVAKQIVRYEGGVWSLPARLEPADLPHDLEDAFKQRLAGLSAPARYLVEAHALSLHPLLARHDYARLVQHAGLQRVDDLIGELLAQQVVSPEGLGYALSHRAWSDAARAGLEAASLAQRHLALAALYDRGDAFRYERAHHLLLGGQEALGLDLVIQAIEGAAASAALTSATTLSAGQLTVILARALDSAETLAGRPQRDAYELRRALASMSIATDDAYYLRVQPLWFERLRQDSGLAFYEALGHVEDPGQRLMQALTRASEVHQSTPEAERVYSPQEAIKGLVHYTVITIALGSRTQSAELLMPLPRVLEPFAPLSPVIAAVSKNALATRESNCDSLPERALAHWAEVQAVLANVSTTEMPYVGAVRSAVWYGIGLVEARLGMKAAEERAKLLDQDPLQQVSAMALRKIARLHQGDFDGAERCRKQGEALSLLSPIRQMFSSTLTAELVAYAMSSDLVGIRQVGEAMKQYTRYPGWLPYAHLADGYFEHTRGELGAARAAFERGIALCQPDAQQPLRSIGAWPRLEAAYIEVLIALGSADEAKARGELALRLCGERQIVYSAFSIERALALAEAKLGEYAQASARLEGVISALRALGVTGLELGASYEARARIAIWASDNAAIEEYARLTAKEYRHGERSPLGARYERLMDEARRAGVQVLPQLTDFHTRLTTTFLSHERSATAIVGEKMALADSKQKRAECALRLLCESRSASAGQLYLQTEHGLELAATFGVAAASPAQHGFVRRYLAEQLDTVDIVTAISEGEGAVACVASQWLAPDGVAHHPVLLMGDVDGTKICAGAALLQIGERTATGVAALQLSEALATYLLLMGDVRPPASSRAAGAPAERRNA